MRKIIGVIFFAFLLACNNSDCSLIPLKNEYEWVYKTTHYNLNGSIRDTITDTARIINTMEHNGNSFYDLGILLPVRNKDCNTLSLLFDRASNKEIFLKTNVEENQTELFNQPFSGTPADCFVGTKIFGYKDRFTIDGHRCFKNEQLFIDCSGKVFKKVVFFISEKIGIVKISTNEVVAGKERLQYEQNLTSYNFLVEEEL